MSVTAPAVDNLTTLADLKTMFGITTTAEDTLLNLLIPQVSALIIKSLKRAFVLASNAANPITQYLNGDGDEWLILSEWPVQAPILTGDTEQNSNIVTNLSSTNYLFAGQSVIGPGIPSGAMIQSVGVNQVTLTQAATAMATGVSLRFGLAVWEDSLGAWGSGDNAFASTSQLVEGQDFALRRDQVDGSSDSAMVCRLNNIWGNLWQREALALSSHLIPGQGNIKVTYWAGYDSLPPDLELACIKSIAKARNNRLYGEALASQSYSDKVANYAYTLANLPDVKFGLLSGEVGAILANYRRLRQGSPT